MVPSRYPDDWTLRAKCRGMEDALFPEGADQKRARQICMGCPVRSECLAEALDNRIEWGVWGGMTERERRQLLRQRTDIQSWSAVLLGGRDKRGKKAEAAVPPAKVAPKKVDVTPEPTSGKKTTSAAKKA